MKEDLFVAKAFYAPGEFPSFVYVGVKKQIDYTVYHLSSVLAKGTVLAQASKTGRKTFQIDKHLSAGTYGLEIDGPSGHLITSFSVGDCVLANPHYGFIADFSAGPEAGCLDSLLKMHVNIAQFYDWMYRHEDYLAPFDPFVDPMGKVKSQSIVKKKIEACHKVGIAAFAYGAIYGATNEFAALHPSWVLRDGEHKPITFIDRFTIMDFATSPWRGCLLDNYEKAITSLSFDGIHMDTYGSPKEAYSSSGKLVRFDEEFVSLIDEAAERLSPLGAAVTFNNVGGWPLSVTAHAKDAFDYAEVWDPLSDYRDLLALVRFQHALAPQKPFVVAAYLKPYYESDDAKASYAHAYLSSLLYASGAHHLIYGEENRVLRTGYYVDSHQLSEQAFAFLRRYEDFAERYGELLFDKDLFDVSLTHVFGENQEYRFGGALVSVQPKAGSVLCLIREKADEKLISFVNFSGLSSTAWNEEKAQAVQTSGPTCDILVGTSDWEAFAADPESDQRLIRISTTIVSSDRGYRIRFDSGLISLWKLILIVRKKG